MPSNETPLLLRALRGEETERAPVWLMRQAGRTDPEYLRLRDASGLSLEDLFRHPEFAAEITLLPKRLGVDALIFYQDILTPLSPMGAHFVFRPGPALTEPVWRAEDLDRLEPFDVPTHLGFVGETFARVRALAGGDLPVLGFAGAPFTLLAFIAEGKSFGAEIPATLNMIEADPARVRAALERLTDMTVAYLRYQAEAGAAAVQLFESAAFATPPELYREFALPYQQRIFAALRGLVPTIQFARDWPRLEDLDAAGADVISLPASISVTEARRALGARRVFQGNLDNRMLVTAPAGEIEAAARACLRDGGFRGHIFNLSHGLLKETPYENVQRVVRTVRDTPNPNWGAED